jgi:hypothetical protein
MTFEAIAVLLLSRDFHFVPRVGNYVFFHVERQAISSFFSRHSPALGTRNDGCGTKELYGRTMAD